MIKLDEEIKGFLHKTVGFEVEDWGSFEEILTKKEVKKGDHFFQHLDRSEEVALVTKGLFRIYLIDNESEERTFSFIPEKEFIIDFFLTWDKSPTAPMVSVQAIEDSELLCVKYPALVELMKNNPVWSDFYREILIRYYRSKTKREIEFVLYNAKQRLQLFMRSDKLNINRIPKSYLASYLGIAPPSLSRLFRELKN